MVYVVNKKGKPLMPTDRYGHVRKLLKNGLAVPINNNPFTIRLKYPTKDIVQSLTCGLDVGRENIGIAVSSKDGKCLFRANLKTGNKSITKKMQERKEHRRSRRRYRRMKKQRRAMAIGSVLQKGIETTLRNKKPCKEIEISYPGMDKAIKHKVIKGKEARFNNRKHKEGWITPSARQLIQMHLSLVKLVNTFLPIDRLVIEHNVFDFQKLENKDIKNWEYSKGLLYGFRDYKDYISKQQNHKCLLCTNSIDHYHHIIPVSKNGSNTVSNIAGLCEGCHRLVHTESSYEFELSFKKKGIHKKYEISILNSCIHLIIEELSKLYKTEITTGYDTSIIRKALNLEKDHNIDAYCISLFGLDIKEPILLSKRYELKRFKKKSNGVIIRFNSRKYYYRGKLVATNRHKALEQKEDSLEEYLNKYRENHTEKETLKHMHELEIRPAKREYTYHKQKKDQRKSVIFHCGDKVKYYKKNKNGKVKKAILIVESVKASDNSLVYNKTKSIKMKFCTALEQKTIAFI